MTRVLYDTATTLNGFLADERDSLDWLFAVPTEGLPDTTTPSNARVIVMGSTTYEWILRELDLLAKPEAWVGYFGAIPTFVFTSRSLPVPEGVDVGFVSGAVASAFETIRAAADGGDVWLQGGGELAGQFLDAGLLDEIALSVAPAALGSGAPLLPRTVGSDVLELVSVAQQGQFARLVYRVRR